MDEKDGLAGMKMTRQRLKIIEILRKAPGEMSAEEILREAKADYPSMALTTVYRNLDALLLNRCLSKTICGDGAARYEYKENSHVHRHYLICMDCNKKIELTGCPINALERGIAEETGFEVTGHNLEIYGYCKACGQRRHMEEKNNKQNK